jgi:hypothetical protein
LQLHSVVSLYNHRFGGMMTSGLKLYAIIVAAILTCAAVIGALFLVNALDKAQRQAHTARAMADCYALQTRAQTVSYLADQVHGGFDLYLEYLRLPQDATDEQRKAKLDEIEAKLKQMQQAQLEREAARLNMQYASPSPSPKAR